MHRLVFLILIFISCSASAQSIWIDGSVLISNEYHFKTVDSVFLTLGHDTIYATKYTEDNQLLLNQSRKSKYKRTFFDDGSRIEERSDKSNGQEDRSIEYYSTEGRKTRVERWNGNTQLKCEEYYPNGRTKYSFHKTLDQETIQYWDENNQLLYSRVVSPNTLELRKVDTLNGVVYEVQSRYRNNTLEFESISRLDHKYHYQIDCVKNEMVFFVRDGENYYSEELKNSNFTREWNDSLGVQKDIINHNSIESMRITPYGRRNTRWLNDTMIFDEKVYHADGNIRLPRTKTTVYRLYKGRPSYSIALFEKNYRSAKYFALYDADSNLLREAKVKFDNNGDIKREKVWYAKSERQKIKRPLFKPREKKSKSTYYPAISLGPYMPTSGGFEDLTSELYTWRITIDSAPKPIFTELLYFQKGDSTLFVEELENEVFLSQSPLEQTIILSNQSGSFEYIRMVGEGSLREPYDKRLEWLKSAELRYGCNASLDVYGEREEHLFIPDRPLQAAVKLVISGE